MPRIYAKGHQILALFNIDYEDSIEEIVSLLMKNPNSRFRLLVERAPKKTK